MRNIENFLESQAAKIMDFWDLNNSVTDPEIRKDISSALVEAIATGGQAGGMDSGFFNACLDRAYLDRTLEEEK